MMFTELKRVLTKIISFITRKKKPDPIEEKMENNSIKVISCKVNGVKIKMKNETK